MLSLPELLSAVGVTDEALAMVSEGFCPRHRMPMTDGGQSWLPWCAHCYASWTPLTLSEAEGIKASRLVEGVEQSGVLFRARD